MVAPIDSCRSSGEQLKDDATEIRVRQCCGLIGAERIGQEGVRMLVASLGAL